MFYNGLDRKKVLIILAVCAILVLVVSGGIETVLLTLPGVIIAMTFHEFAHAFVADELGDTTPRAQGRVTLNPASHIDPVGLVLLLFAHIGWGRPVEINPNNFNSNKSIETCEALVSLAGPVMNFILAFIFMIVYYALYRFTSVSAIVLYVVYYTVIVNIGLGVFNLIPIPPLDGSKIFSKFLPYNVKAWLDRNMQYIYLIFLILWITGILSYIVSPVINVILTGLNYAVIWLFGIFI